MNTLKNIGLAIGISLIVMLSLTLFMTLLSYINILGVKGNIIFSIIIISISLFSGGIVIGSKQSSKGWLGGLKYALVFLILLFIIDFFIFNVSINFKFFVFCSIIVISSALGGMVGINKFKKNDSK